MKVDLSKNGLEMFYGEPWQAELVSWALEQGGEFTNRQAWAYLIRKTQLSRASVINFMAKLADQKVLAVRQKTGKGGFHPVYTTKPRTVGGYDRKLPDLTKKALMERLIRETLDALEGCGVDMGALLNS